MKYLLFSLFLFVNLAFGYDSTEILNPLIHINKSGWLKSDKPLSPEEAYRNAQEGNFLSLPKVAKSFGFDTAEYWFTFDVAITDQDPHYFLDIRDPLAESCTLYVFQNGKLIRTETNGYMIPIYQRPIEQFPIRFSLNTAHGQTTYLVKTSSQFPIYASYAFGNQNEINKTWELRHLIFVLSCGVFISMFFYNLFLYFFIQDKAYVYYCLYIFGFFMITSIAQGYCALFLPALTMFSTLYLGLFLQIEFIGLVYFSIHFLRLNKSSPSLERTLRYLLYANIVASFTIPIAHGIQILSMILMNTLYLILIYAGIRSYRSGFKPALYYLIATGIALLSIIAYSFMNQGIVLPFNLWSYNLMTFGLIWDMVFLSLALAYRIRLLQEEILNNERFAIMKSRQKVIGELTGNIAHQWRQPLNTLGAIISNVEGKIRYSHLSNEELIESCRLSMSVLQHLSGTINTLQDFFVDQGNNKENFDLNEHLANLIHFLEDSMSNHQITIDFHPKKTLMICSNQNLLSQVIMNILLNAKDTLVKQSHNLDKRIVLTTKTENENVIVTVNDNGEGIKIDPVEKVFEPFISSKADGSGIGLYLSKNIIEKLGGTLHAENDLNGAKFIISLPIK